MVASTNALKRLTQRLITQRTGIPRLALNVNRIVFFENSILSRAERWEAVMFTKIGKEIVRSSNRSMVDVKDKRFRGKQNVPASRPGQPPRARVGYLKKFNKYAYERGVLTVGPWKLPGMKQAIPAPGLHEHGGVMDVKQWGKQGLKKLFPKRPFMKPALDRTMSRFYAGKLKFNFK